MVIISSLSFTDQDRQELPDVVYQRSYVMLEGGVVVYGNLVRFYDG